MGVLLGAISSVVLGVADFFGARATQRADGFSVVFLASFTALPLALVAAFLAGSFSAGGVGLGLLAGLGTGVGLGSLYRGFAAASTGVVAPIAAVLAALLPVSYDLARGTRLGGLAIIGIVIGLSALILTTWAPDISGRIAAGVGFGALAGISVGFGITVLGSTGSDAGIWPIVGQRITVLAVTGIVAGLTAGVRPFGSEGLSATIPHPSVRSLALWSGVLSTFGVAAFVLGSQRGDLAAVAVAGSQFPAVTVGLTAIFGGERLRWWQVAGLAFAIVGISLIALD